MNSKISIIFVLSILLFSAFLSKTDDMKVYCSLAPWKYKIHFDIQKKKLIFYGRIRHLENELLFESDCKNLVITYEQIYFELKNYKFQNMDLSYVNDSIANTIFTCNLPNQVSGFFLDNGNLFKVTIDNNCSLSNFEEVTFKLMP